MSKEGYLQIKLSEMEDKLKQGEEKINLLVDVIKKKEKDINYLIEGITPKLKEAQEIIKKREEFSESMSKSLEETRDFHKKHYNQMFKHLLKEVNMTLDKLKDEMNYTIIDHMTHSFVLLKLLVDKGILNPMEMLQYIEKYHDKIRDLNLQDGMPQKTLEIVDGNKNEL